MFVNSSGLWRIQFSLMRLLIIILTQKIIVKWKIYLEIMYVISALCISNPQRRTAKWGSEHQQWDILQLDSSEITSNGLDVLSYSLARLNKRYKRGSTAITRWPLRWNIEHYNNSRGWKLMGEWKILYLIPAFSGIALLVAFHRRTTQLKKYIVEFCKTAI